MPYQMYKHNGFFRVDNLPIFAQYNAKGEETCTPEVINRMITYASKQQLKGYFPPVHIGHHREYMEQETEVCGYLINQRAVETEGWGLTVYADFAGIPEHFKRDFSQNKYPHRSIEMEAEEGEEEILSMALLSHIVPHFQFPNMNVNILEELPEMAEMPVRMPVLSFAKTIMKQRRAFNMPCPDEKKKEDYQEEKPKDKGEKKPDELETMKKKYADLEKKYETLLEKSKKFQEDEEKGKKEKMEEKEEKKKDYNIVLEKAMEFKALGLENAVALHYAELGVNPDHFQKLEKKNDEEIDTSKKLAGKPKDSLNIELFEAKQKQLAQFGIKLTEEAWKKSQEDVK